MIFIRCKIYTGEYINKDIFASTQEERDDYYSQISPGKLESIIDDMIMLKGGKDNGINS